VNGFPSDVEMNLSDLYKNMASNISFTIPEARMFKIKNKIDGSQDGEQYLLSELSDHRLF
jgi:hypothetical protein